MNVRHIRERLLPRYESDQQFRQYLGRISGPGVQALAIVEIVAPVLLEAGRIAVGGGLDGIAAAMLWRAGAVIAVGFGTLAVSWTRWSSRHARLIAAVSAWLASSVLAWFGLHGSNDFLSADDYILAGITLILLTAVATVPLMPWHTVVLGLAVQGMYILSSSFQTLPEISSALQHAEAQNVFLFILTVLATGISVTNYQHRQAEFEAAQQAVRAAEALTGAQLRAQLAENAISIGKMAAALSHEINSPVGALRSSIETLLALTDRQLEASPGDRKRFGETRAELCRSIRESAARIEEVTLRLRRFVNLEEAELKQADVNDLISDVALLHQDEIAKGGIQVDFQLQKPMPPLSCRPQLLTAVFSSLLSNAIHAVNGNGHIEISTRREPGQVEVTIRDNGRGMPPEQVATIFDPSFKVEGGRISSGNWSLFSTRQIVYEHGGDIRLDTALGKGTTVSVILPAA